MKRRIYGCVVFALVSFCCLLALLAFAVSKFDPCENTVIKEVRSPDGEFKFVIFDRGCGATTGFNTQVSILPTTSTLPSDAGNIFIADSNDGAAPLGPSGGPDVEVEWLNQRELKITYDHRARVFTKLETYQGVTISYWIY